MSSPKPTHARSTCRARLLGTAVTFPMLLVAGLAQAGTLLDAPLAGVSGDGFIFADPAEGVLEPGLKAITPHPMPIGTRKAPAAPVVC